MVGDFMNPPAFEQPVAIYQDGGGLVEEYSRQAFRYRMENREVRIMGSCRSACLLALSVPNVCVGPDVEIKAHHAYDQKTGAIRPDVTAQMLAQIPVPVAMRLAPAIRATYWGPSTLHADDLAALGIRRCGGGNASNVVANDAKPVKVKFTDPVTKFLDAMFGKLGVK